MGGFDLGLTFGDLRRQVMRMEQITVDDGGDEDTSREYAQLDIHVRHMTLIQIAQELNEIKTILGVIAQSRVEKASTDAMPFIH